MTDGIGQMWAVVGTSLDAECASVWIKEVIALSHIERWAKVYCERYNRKLVKDQIEKHGDGATRRYDGPKLSNPEEELYQQALTADEPCLYVWGWAIVTPAPEVRYTDIS